MAEIKSFVFVRHLRAEPSAHVVAYRRGRVTESGKGLSFWFLPMTTSIAEIPTDDREVPLAVHGRSRDFQDVTVQGIVSYRVVDARALADRVDFAIDTRLGVHLRQPVEKIALYISQLAEQHASAWVGHTPLREVLRDGPAEVRERVLAALSADEGLAAMGLAITSVRVSSLVPSSDLERALEAPMREKIQEEADQAAFARRALAVEKERAIQENELQNRIELAKREETLIAQDGANARRRAEEASLASRIAAEADAERTRLSSDANASSIRAVEGAKVEQERARMEIARATPTPVLAALAARELAGKLSRIDHLHIGGDALGPMLTDLVSAGTSALAGRSSAE